jgi:hypothetical protein
LRLDEFLERINATLPPGLRFLVAVPLERGAPSLAKIVNRVLYRAEVPADLVNRAVSRLNGQGEGLTRDEAHRVVLSGFLEREALPYTRRRENKVRQVDLRPFLLELSPAREGQDIRLTFSMDNGRTARPHEVLSLLYGEGSESVLVTRLEQLVARGGKTLSPLLVAGRD